MRRSRRLTLELLEDRCTPATFGVPWPNPGQITLSFAPDGTADAGQSSQLFHTLNNLGSTATWQETILRAFQTWAVNANLNFSVVGDGGEAFGSAGAVQGDARFGDVRVGALDLDTAALAKTVPFDWEGGTWMGDMNLNTSYQYTPGGQQAGTYDLFTVALHEAGHSLGLPDNMDPTSVMDQNYSGAITGPSAGDVANLRAIYGGARTPDKFGGANQSFATAAPVALATSSGSAAADVINADNTTTHDQEYYAFTVAKKTGPATVELRTAGISSFVGGLTVFNGAKSVLASSSATDPMNGNLALHFSSLTPGTYYVKVAGASSNVFGVGGYQLFVHTDNAPPPASVLFTQQSVLGGLLNINLQNESLNTATTLTPRTTTGDPRFNYSAQGSIGLLQNVHYYKLTTPVAGSPGAGGVMTVVVWGSQLGLLDPQVTVYNAAQQPVAVNVLVHDDDTFVVQLPNATPGATYYLGVSGSPSSNVLTGLLSSVLGGNYYLGVDLSNTATTITPAVSGALTAAAPSSAGALTVSSSSLYHFILSAKGSSGLLSSPTVRLTIYDAHGNAVFTLQAGAGQTSSGNMYLVAGKYEAVFVAQGSLTFSLGFQKLTDNMDPYTVDSTNDGASASPPPPSNQSPPPPSSQPAPPPQNQPSSNSNSAPPTYDPPSDESSSPDATWGPESSSPSNSYNEAYMY